MNQDIIELARNTALKYALDGALVCAVVEQESSGNTYAIRYEPGFFARYLAPLYTANKLNPTESYARAFSWGLMQVMGQVARENGFEGPLAALCEPAIGLDIGCKVLAGKIAQANGDLEAGLLRWNGGGNPDYPSQVIARKSKYILSNASDVQDALTST